MLNKGFLRFLILNEFVKSKNIIFNYLYWYLSLEEVRKYLSIYLVGVVFLRILRKIIDDILVLVFLYSYIEMKVMEVIIKKENFIF